MIALAGRFAEGLTAVPFAGMVDDLAALKLKRLSLHVAPPDPAITDGTVIVCPGLTEEILASWARQYFRDARADADLRWQTIDERVELSVALRDGTAGSSNEAAAASQLIETIL